MASPRDVVATEAQWMHVGLAVRTRRTTLGYTLDDVVERSGRTVSRSVLTNLEGFKQLAFRRRSLVGVCRALGWTDDSIDRLLDGKTAQLLPGSSLTSAPPVARTESMSPLHDRLASVEADIAEIKAHLRELDDALDR